MMLDRTALHRKPYSSGDIAAALDKSSDWFYRNKAELIASHGMPEPMPGPGHPKWKAELIEPWLLRRKPPAPAANDAVPVAAPEFSAWQAAAEAEYRITR